MTTFFVACAVIGIGLLLVGIVVGDVFGLDVDAEGVGALSIPAVGAFLGAFGLGGLLVGAVSDGPAAWSIGGGAVAGVALAAAAIRLTRALMGMPTDATVTSGHFMGALGRVVTPIVSGRGEVMLRVGGVPQKLSATSDADLGRGTEVVVIEVLSASAVRVIPVSELMEGSST